MAVNSKTTFFRKRFLCFNEAAISEIYYLAALGADEMVVMFGRSSHHVATAAIPCMDLAHEIKITQKLKRAIDSNPTDIRVF